MGIRNSLGAIVGLRTRPTGAETDCCRRDGLGYWLRLKNLAGVLDKKLCGIASLGLIVAVRWI